MTVVAPQISSFRQMLPAVEVLRMETNRLLSKKTQVELGQYTTPRPVAEFMASLLAVMPDRARLLDAGAGTGSLTTAAVTALHASGQVRAIDCVAAELDPVMLASLAQTCEWLNAAAREEDFELNIDVAAGDFLTAFLTSPVPVPFTHVMLNPPYKRIAAHSPLHTRLTAAGLDATNLYTAFLDLAIELLAPGGELVAITPRSYFNGVYYKAFRRKFLSSVSIDRIHLIDSRKSAFRDNDVLQETVIVHARKAPQDPAATVLISSSFGFDPGDAVSVRTVPYTTLVHVDDPEQFIRVDLDDDAAMVSSRVRALPATLADLGLKASTGRVVDFREREHIGTSEEGRGHALIYAGHFCGGEIAWPTPLIGKPNVVHEGPQARRLLVPEGHYVLIKRFSAKEESRRVSAALYDPAQVRDGPVGFDNKLNYIHAQGQGLPEALARGLCGYLNSTPFDTAFRQFSGHTQVNATDLRQMRFPDQDTLEELGRRMAFPLPSQRELDLLVQAVVFD